MKWRITAYAFLNPSKSVEAVANVFSWALLIDYFWFEFVLEQQQRNGALMPCNFKNLIIHRGNTKEVNVQRASLYLI